MSNIHINSIHIDTYRGIRKLQLEGFTGVNIFTRDNNCGKTSIQELMNTLINPADVQVWQSLIRRPFEQKRNISYYEGFIDLFDKSSSENSKIGYSIFDSKNNEHKVTVTYDIKQESVATSTVNILSRMKLSSEEKRTLANRLYLTFNYGLNPVNTYKLFESQDSLDYHSPNITHSLFNKTIKYVFPTEHGRNTARRLSAERAIEADENFGLELK